MPSHRLVGLRRLAGDDGRRDCLVQFHCRAERLGTIDRDIPTPEYMREEPLEGLLEHLIASHRPDQAVQVAFEGAARAALDEAKRQDLLRGSLSAHAVLTADPERVELPGSVLDAAARKLAIGVARAPGEARFAVVFLVLK